MTSLRFLRRSLHALVLPATAFAILLGVTLGGLAPLLVLDWVGARSEALTVVLGAVGGLLGVAGAYVAGDRLNDRIRRLRASIGTASVGADGIRWRHFGTEFIGWAAVRDIEQRASEVVLQLEGRGETVLQVQEASALATAARAAMQRYRDAAPHDASLRSSLRARASPNGSRARESSSKVARIATRTSGRS